MNTTLVKAPALSNLKKLATLMDSAIGSSPNWHPDELGAIFRHQLAAPVPVDLAAVDDTVRPKLRQLCLAEGLLLKSFRDLFTHPHPPVELLRLVKDYAKANRHLPESPLPREVATALYYLSIAVALAKTKTRISKMNDAELATAFARVRDLPWLDTDMQALLDHALAALAKTIGSA